jgi:hypothetical protein
VPPRCGRVEAPPLRFRGQAKSDSGGILMDWARILAFVTGAVNQELLARAEYLAAENHPEGAVERAAEAFGRRASHAG